MIEIGKKIEKLRIENNESICQASKAIGVNKQKYQRVVDGKTDISVSLLKKILLHYNVSFSLFFEDVDVSGSNNPLKQFFFEGKGKLLTLITAITMIVYIVSLLIGSISNFFNAVNNVTNINSQQAKVELVDIKIEDAVGSDDNDYRFPLIDIKLRNTGREMAYLYKVEVSMLDYFVMSETESGNMYLPTPASDNYDILLTDDSLQSYGISQVLPGNDVDRFTLSFAISNQFALCYFNMKLYYNESSYIEFEPMVIPVVTFRDLKGTYIGGDNLDALNGNYEALCRFNGYKAIKSKYFLKLYQLYETAKANNFDIF